MSNRHVQPQWARCQLRRRTGKGVDAEHTTKPGAWAPGICLLSRGAREIVGAQLRDGLRDRSLIVRSGCLWLWGRSCRRWHLGPGVEWDVPWAPGHLRRSRERCSGRRGSPSGIARQEQSEIRRKCWSRGRIVSALLAGAQGGCLPSVEPPNPMHTRSDGEALAATSAARSDRSLHLRQRGFMKGGSPPAASAPARSAHRNPSPRALQ